MVGVLDPDWTVTRLIRRKIPRKMESLHEDAVIVLVDAVVEAIVGAIEPLKEWESLRSQIVSGKKDWEVRK